MRRFWWRRVAGGALLLWSTTSGWRLIGARPQAAPHDAAAAARLKHHVQVLSDAIGPRDMAHFSRLEEAARYVEACLARAGFHVESHAYRLLGLEPRNLIARIPGRDPDKPQVLIGAHYDSFDGPGADDNASGVAVLLELAARLAGQRPECPVTLAAFVNEEPPFFQTDEMGSRVYARQASARGERIALMLSLEMLGYYDQRLFSQRYPPLFGPFYPNQGTFIGLVGKPGTGRLLRRFADGFRHGTAFPLERVATFRFIPGIEWSDHWSFWQEGYPAAMLTDTAFLRNPHYHGPADTWETLDYGRMAAVADGVETAIREFAR
jgi:hypothetical protein